MAPQEVDRIIAVMLAQLNNKLIASTHLFRRFDTHLSLWHWAEDLMQKNDVVFREKEERWWAESQLPRITEEDQEHHDREAKLYQVALADRQRTLLQLTRDRDDNRRAFLEELPKPEITAFFEELNDMSFYWDYPAQSDLPAQIARVRTYTRHSFPMIDNPGVPIYEYLAPYLFNFHGFCMYATPDAVETLVRTLRFPHRPPHPHHARPLQGAATRAASPSPNSCAP
jgi:hypothetical protein